MNKSEHTSSASLRTESMALFHCRRAEPLCPREAGPEGGSRKQNGRATRASCSQTPWQNGQHRRPRRTRWSIKDHTEICVSGAAAASDGPKRQKELEGLLTPSWRWSTKLSPSSLTPPTLAKEKGILISSCPHQLSACNMSDWEERLRTAGGLHRGGDAITCRLACQRRCLQQQCREARQRSRLASGDLLWIEAAGWGSWQISPPAN